MLGFDSDDTIAAIATAPGGGLRGVIRLSGETCLIQLPQLFELPSELLALLSGPANGHNAKQPLHVSTRINVSDSDDRLMLEGELLIWPSLRSYTRQPSAEFHTIASPPLLTKVLKRICTNGVRLANPGEFTLRAFLSGRLDLPQAEAVLSVIDAHGDQQLNVALRQLAGGLSGPLDTARRQLLYVLAELEAGLDFVEEDLEFLSKQQVCERLQGSLDELERIKSQIRSREFVAHNPRVVITGLPNAGKSTLFNALLESHRAIVSNQSGTTTDALLGTLEMDGFTVELVDTAGMEIVAVEKVSETPPELAQEQRAAAESGAAIRLLCVDQSRPLTQWEKEQLESLVDSNSLDTTTIVVLTKSDLGALSDLPSYLTQELIGKWQAEHRWARVQIPAIDSLSPLRAAIRYWAVERAQSSLEVVASTLARTAGSLDSAIAMVGSAWQGANNETGDEIVAAEIRGALSQLGQVVGTVYTDDILDIIFSRFCIGK